MCQRSPFSEVVINIFLPQNRPDSAGLLVGAVKAPMNDVPGRAKRGSRLLQSSPASYSIGRDEVRLLGEGSRASSPEQGLPRAGDYLGRARLKVARCGSVRQARRHAIAVNAPGDGRPVPRHLPVRCDSLQTVVA